MTCYGAARRRKAHHSSGALPAWAMTRNVPREIQGSCSATCPNCFGHRALRKATPAIFDVAARGQRPKSLGDSGGCVCNWLRLHGPPKQSAEGLGAGMGATLARAFSPGPTPHRFSKRRKDPATLPNTAWWDDEVHISRSNQRNDASGEHMLLRIREKRTW